MDRILNTKYSLAAKIGSIVLLIAFLSGMHVSYAQQSSAASFNVFAEDTIAGYGSTLTTSALAGGADVTFDLKKPQGSIITFTAKADDRGIATTDVSSFHTQAAGMYNVTAKVDGQKAETTFQVFADKPAPTLSRVTANKKMAAANGKDNAEVTVELKDGFGNPVEKHQIALVSSRPDDTIVLSSPTAVSGADGIVVFKVASVKDGLATLTAMDMTNNAVVGERESVLFSSDAQTGSTASVITPSQLQASLLTQVSTTPLNSSASRLRIRTEPTNRVAVGDYYNIIVEVLTQNGQPATDYRGTLLFTSTDTNAELPLKTTGYQFTGGEQPAASKTFSQAARFLSAGEKTIQVVDRDNVSLSASFTITAFDRAGGTTATTTPIMITRPQAGILTGKDITVEGTATAYQELHIYDNGVDINKVTADAQGVFTATLGNLTDGTHKVEVKAQDTGGNVTASSDAVTVSLRSSTPTVKSLTYDPVGPKFSPAQSVKVIVTADAGLSRVLYSLQGQPFQLTADAQVPGQYTGTITLPAQSGSFDATVQVENSFGITGNQSYPASVTIAPSFNMDSVAYDPNSPTTINVSWQTPTTALNQKLRLAYGMSADALNQTKDIPTAQSPFTLDGLTGNTTYYVQLQALDTSGAVLQQSTTKAVTTPQGLAISGAQADNADGKLLVRWSMVGPKSQVTRYHILYGISPENYTKEQYADASVSSVTLEPLVDNTLHYLRVQALGQNGAPLVQSSEFTGTPMTTHQAAPAVCQPADVTNLRVTIIDEKKYLEWDAVPNAEGYKVYMGLEEGKYSSNQVINQNRFPVPTLDKTNKHYFFAVTAMCDGHESLSISKAVKVESGPMLWAAIALLMGLSGAGIYMYRRRVRVV